MHRLNDIPTMILFCLPLAYYVIVGHKLGIPPRKPSIKAGFNLSTRRSNVCKSPIMEYRAYGSEAFSLIVISYKQVFSRAILPEK